jgi:hypothetical protein
MEKLTVEMVKETSKKLTTVKREAITSIMERGPEDFVEKSYEAGCTFTVLHNEFRRHLADYSKEELIEMVATHLSSEMAKDFIASMS